MESPSLVNDLRRARDLLWQWGWLILLVALAAGGIACYLSIRTRPVYQALTILMVEQAPETNSVDYTSVLTSERLAQTYAQLLTTHSIIEEVMQRLGLEGDVDELARAIQVQLIRDTQLIELRLEDIDPERAAKILNTLASVFIEQNQSIQAERFSASKENLSRQLGEISARIQQLDEALQAQGNAPENRAERDRLETTLAQYRQIYSSLLSSFEQVRLAETQSTSHVIQIEPAYIPVKPIRPRPGTNAALGGLIGAALSLAGIFVAEALDERIKGVKEVQHHLKLPVLGLIARHEPESRPITVDQPLSQVAETYRLLKAHLQSVGKDRPLRTILVTSPSTLDGKSMVAANLGIVYAQSGSRVVLIALDLNWPGLYRAMGISNQGDADSLSLNPGQDVGKFLQETGVVNLKALVAGEALLTSSQFLDSKAGEILERLGENVEVVVIDAPPVLTRSDTVVLSRYVDGVLLVINPRRSNLAQSKQAIDRLQMVGASVTGVVLNEVNFRHPGYTDYRGY